MKTIDELKEGDYIAFGFNYNGGEPNEIIVDNITKIYNNSVLVHFMYGHHSLSEEVKLKDILAIGNNESGENTIKGWRGKYDFLQREKLEKLLNENKKV